MKKMKHQLGVMDLYPISANKTPMENNPFFQVKLKEPVNAERLHTAVKQSLGEHPLFACTLRYKKGYYLETNEKEFLLIRAAEENRPLAFGDATNGFLWQMCYDEYTISFEWCHAISDGRGAFDFFSSVLCHYFGVEKKADIDQYASLYEFATESITDLKSLLDMYGIAASSGSACSARTPEPSHVLRAMRIDKALASSSLRISIDEYNTEEEITQVINKVTFAIERMRNV